MVQNKKTSNPDIRLLVLARPADVLSALVREVVPQRHTTTEFYNSVFDAIAAVHAYGLDGPVILIARPSMLAKPHLAAVLRQYPNLRLIGWLGPDEHRIDPTVPIQAMVTVSTRDQLARVIAAIRNVPRDEHAGSDLQAPKQKSKLEPANYRLSNEERAALLGTG